MRKEGGEGRPVRTRASPLAALRVVGPGEGCQLGAFEFSALPDENLQSGEYCAKCDGAWCLVGAHTVLIKVIHYIRPPPSTQRPEPARRRRPPPGPRPGGGRRETERRYTLCICLLLECGDINKTRVLPRAGTRATAHSAEFHRRFAFAARLFPCLSFALGKLSM